MAPKYKTTDIGNCDMLKIRCKVLPLNLGENSEQGGKIYVEVAMIYR